MNQGPICAKVYPEGIQPIKGNNCGLIPRMINRSKLNKRQVSVNRFAEEVKVRITFYASFFSELQNILEIILFTAP